MPWKATLGIRENSFQIFYFCIVFFRNFFVLREFIFPTVLLINLSLRLAHTESHAPPYKVISLYIDTHMYLLPIFIKHITYIYIIFFHLFGEECTFQRYLCNWNGLWNDDFFQRYCNLRTDFPKTVSDILISIDILCTI